MTQAAQAESAPRSGSERVAPLSPAQERLWFVQQLAPEATFDNVPTAMRVEGPLDEAALDRALCEVVRRHEILRTTFEALDGMPRQRVGPPPESVLETRDLRGSDEPVAEARRVASAEATAPFDLERGPLLRALLLRLGPADHVLMLSLHHIVCDAASFGLLARELELLYAAFAQGRPSPLPELPLQYADFSLWQRAWLETEERAEASAYWRSRVTDAPQLLELHYDRPRPRRRERPGRFFETSLADDVYGAVCSFARSQAATPFVVLLSALAVLLARHSRRDDLLVGVPSLLRPRTEVEQLIGCFLNILCLRLDLSGDPSFRELVARVRAEAFGAFAYQELPFEELLKELDVERSTSHPPLVQICFGVRPGDDSPLELSGCRTCEFPLDGAAVAYDLFVDVADGEERTSCTWAYNDDLFEEATVVRMARQFEVLAGEAARRPDARISDLPLLTPRERETVLKAWNATWRPSPAGCVHELVAEQARRRPDAPAVSGAGETLSYGELERRVHALAAALRRRGIGVEEPVGVLVERSPALVVALLAVLRTGGAYVPLDPAHPSERLAAALRSAGARIVVAGPRAGEEVDLAGFDVLAADAEEDGGALNGMRSAPGTLAYVVFTSGSTGGPKGVAVTHGALANVVASFGADLALRDSDALVAVTTVGFDIAALELFLPLVHGARLVLATDDEAHDGRRLAALLDGSGATILQATPATWQLLLDAGWEPPEELTALCGGEALPPALAERLAPRTRLWNVYGPSETTIWSTTQRLEPPPARTIPIGRPIANTRVYVLGERAAPLPAGVPGEIHIGGDGVARGYVGAAALTAERFVPDPFGEPGGRLYRTGDLGRFLADGSLEFLGRLDHQLKVRGFRVEPAEIERALTELPGVREAVVVVRADDAGSGLVAYLAATRELDAEELRAALARTLPEYMVPSAFVVLDALPRNTSGKVDRRALPDPHGDRSALGAAFVPPAEGPEELVAEVWREVLGLDRVGALDNFFELGGHSLAVARVRFRLETIFGVDPPLVELMEQTTVRAQAALVEELVIEQIRALSDEEAERALG